MENLTPAEDGHLRRGELGTRGIVFLVLAAAAPMGAIVVTVPLSMGFGTGVGTPGAVSPATGLIKNANSTQLNGRPLAADLSSALGREVRLANDADCFALSESSDGAGAGRRVVFGVILGTGVGGGLVVDGRLLGGPNAIAVSPPASRARSCAR